jgi:hypothetical protein
VRAAEYQSGVSPLLADYVGDRAYGRHLRGRSCQAECRGIVCFQVIKHDINVVLNAREIKHVERVTVFFDNGRHSEDAKCHEYTLIKQED